MPYIKVIDKNNAEGNLKQIYDNIIRSRGKLSNIMAIHSLLPDTMIKHLDLYKSIMFGKSNVSREFKEMIAVVVSKANNCDYCINHHAEAINFYWKDEKKLQRFIEDYRSVELEKKYKLLLDYADKLTVNPEEINLSFIDEIKSTGWTDADILLFNLIISYFNFVNRIALGLGVEFSEDEVKGYKY